MSNPEAVSHTLMGLGYREGEDFIVAFKRGKMVRVMAQAEEYLDFLRPHDVNALELLEVGSGGQVFLGLICLLRGATHVTITDVVAYPDDTLDKYRLVLCDFIDFLAERFADEAVGTGAEVAARDHSAVLDRVTLRTDAISAMDLPYANGRFDGVFNTGVMEHVTDPHRAFEEFRRVTRPGGLLFCLAIGIHDHRTNVVDSGFTPWSFLEIPGEDWGGHDDNAYHQNRWRPVDFRHALREHGFEPVFDRTDRDDSLTDEDRDRFAPEFQHYSRDELLEMNHWFMARRP